MPCPPFVVTTCSLKGPLSDAYIPPFEYSSAKNNKSLRKEKMREGRGCVKEGK